MTAGFDLASRAALLGLSPRAFVRLAQSDPRIVGDAATATTHATRRLRAWIDAGQPDVAPSSIAFHGCDEVRAILVATLASIPAPARWLATHVTWFEIGRGDRVGYMTTFDPRRSIVGDAPHVIVIAGRMADEALPSVIAHELGHALHRSWQSPIADADIAFAAPLTEIEFDARVLAAFEGDCDAAARLLFRGEHLANETAKLWGHPCGAHQCPDAIRLRIFRERMDGVADRAAQIGRQVDIDLEQRAVATIVTTPNQNLRARIT